MDFGFKDVISMESNSMILEILLEVALSLFNFHLAVLHGSEEKTRNLTAVAQS
jgi:hypothetical protein